MGRIKKREDEGVWALVISSRCEETIQLQSFKMEQAMPHYDHRDSEIGNTLPDIEHAAPEQDLTPGRKAVDG